MDRYLDMENQILEKDKQLRQQAEQIGALSASLEMALNQQKIDQAENQRLKEAIFNKSELITLRRFFNRGVRCAKENHDNYEDAVFAGTFYTDPILQKINKALKGN